MVQVTAGCAETQCDHRLAEAVEIIRDLLSIKGEGPADTLRYAKYGIGTKTPTGRSVLRAAEFIASAQRSDEKRSADEAPLAGEPA